MGRNSRYEVEYVDRWGYRRIADLTDHLEREGFVGHCDVPSSALEYVRPGDFVVDAGANVGNVTAALSGRVGEDGCVWAIEPVPRNIARLKQLGDLNSLRQLRVVAGALSSVTGEADIRMPEGGESGFASFTASWIGGGTLQVPVWRLDDLVASEDTPRRISLIKLDVEGSEPEVIRGAMTTLTQMRPIIICEFNDVLLRDRGASSAALLEQFNQAGYRPVDTCCVIELEGRCVNIVLAPGDPEPTLA